MTAVEQPMEARANLAAWLTLERAAYGGVVLFAGLWRMFQLGLYPLGPDEVRQALVAWDAAQGRSVALGGVSPLLFTLQELAFIFTQATDVMVRFWPALAGLAICLIPYALRHRLGRGEALLAASFLVLSPTITYFARYGSGDVMAATFVLAALTAGLAALEDRRWLSWAGVALALALLSGPGVYTALLALGIAGTLWARVDLANGSSEIRNVSSVDHHSEIRNPKSEIGNWWLAGGLVFLLGATAGLRHWDGLGAAAGLLGTWAARWARSELGYPIYWPLLRLILDEPLLLAFGIYGAVVGVRQGYRLMKVLALWAGLAVLWPTLTPGRQPQDLVMAVPPLALLAGQGAALFWRQVDLRQVRTESALFITALGALSVTFYVWVSGYSQWGTTEYVVAMLAPSGLMVGLALFFGLWIGWQRTRQLVALFLSGVGMLWMLSAGWINAHGVDLNRRPAVQFEMTSEETRMLADMMMRLSEQRVGDPHLLPVEIMESPYAPVLRWYLRNMLNLKMVGAPLRDGSAPVVITPLMEELAPGEQYNGQDFVVTERWSPDGLRGRELVRWLLLRQGLTPAEQRRAILWVEREAPVD